MDYLSKLFASHPSNLRSSSPSLGSLVVFWSHDAPLRGVQHMIRDAFEGTEVDDSFIGLIQFWAPVTISGRQLLTTYDQPFALPKPENIPQYFEGLCEYRLSSVKYQYDVDVNGLQAGDDPAIISDGAPAKAFRNQQPELLMHPRFHNTSLLVSLALEDGLMNSIMVPVFDPSQSKCVGVVECSTSSPEELLRVFRKLSIALEKQGLKIDAQEYMPYNTIHGLQHAKDAIDEALGIIWQTYLFPLAQVWIATEDADHVAYSSSSQHTQTKGMIWLKLTGKCNTFDDEDFDLFQDYSYACYKIPSEMGKDFAAGRTLENYEPHFIENILNLSAKKLDRLSSILFRCSCFMIYLRSTKTPGLYYVFEFLWRERTRNNAILESLLLTLKRYLPSFKFASGTELGDEIDILDVNNSEVGEKKYIKVFQRNKMPPQKEMQPRVEESPTLVRAKGNTTQPRVEEFSTPLKAGGKTIPITLTREHIMSLFGQSQHVAAAKLGASSMDIPFPFPGKGGEFTSVSLFLALRLCAPFSWVHSGYARRTRRVSVGWVCEGREPAGRDFGGCGEPLSNGSLQR
ncbi:hypothetical protein OSB04_010261 [Centaurea solstitialis]|uniref:NLP1-9 GAF domain-containing protein n=1 Tax=Centaurea solstitialis TaxID=347529 RepID=A0AA38WCN6_9ASTR|nr:hypothetical protein OSB04_010261 [Centaurea solstitialis]